jgi:antitoxin component of MazEF toxin-antitoxin module
MPLHGGRGAIRASKWANSLAVRLPQAVVDVLGLHEGDSIESMFLARGHWRSKRRLRHPNC